MELTQKELYRALARRPEAPAKNGPCSVCGDSDGKGYCPLHRPELPAPRPTQDTYIVETVIDNEVLADLYIKASGKKRHTNDCSTSIAPAETPGPCDCNTPQPDAPTERTFTAEQVYEAAQAAHTACGFTCEWRYFLNSMMDHLVPPKPKTPEERVAAILRRHLYANTNSYHDAIAAEIVAELAKERP